MNASKTYRDLTETDRMRILRLYAVERMSMTLIGKRFSLAQATVGRVLREMGVTAVTKRRPA